MIDHLLSLALYIIIVLCIAICVWVATTKWSPDPVITKIIQVCIFLVVLLLILQKVAPAITAGL